MNGDFINRQQLFLSMHERPKVGMGVAVINDGKVLLGLRKGSHGPGSWSFPGGHLEYGESFEDCAKRETEEETGVQIKNVRFGTLTNDIFEKEGKHYITIYMVADYASGTLTLMEPDKCERWEWFAWDKLPKPLFLCMQHMVDQGFNPFKVGKGF